MSELLIVGALTVDRFADGRRAPGGSVLHAGLAAAAEGAIITTLTVAGDEPEARAGLERLASLGTLVRQAAGATTTYRHDEHAGRRVLVYETATDPIEEGSLRDLPQGGVALLAPIADELPATVVEALRTRLRPRLTVMLIQGWLRRMQLGAAVHPLALDDVPAALWSAMASADAIVVSTEDLAEAPNDPFSQAAALRIHLGARPILCITLGTEGYLIDDPAADRLVATMPRRVVEGVPTVGAGDTFGAVLAVRLARGDEPSRAAAAATERVIRMLDGRRS